MIDRFFSDPVCKHRMRSGPLGSFVDGFAAFLLANRYAVTVSRTYIRYANLLSYFLTETGRGLNALDDALLGPFEAWVPTSPHVHANRANFFAVASGFRLLVGWLRDEGHIRAAEVIPDTRPGSILAFETWMIAVRGTLPVSLTSSYSPVILRFVNVHGETADSYKAADIRGFVLAEAVRCSPRYAKTVCTALRMFLLFLAATGKCDPGLTGAVPKVANWKMTSLPRHIARADVERLIVACDRSTSVGRRDNAILLLLARLGVRASDVAGLAADDFDWKRGRLWVLGKSKRRVAMPLPQDVGEAVLAYLDDERVGLGGPHVFLSCHAPYGPIQAAAIVSIVMRRAARAGVVLPRAGAHVLRHTLATALLSDGMSLAGIGAVLRHESLETTAIYAKVDQALLAGVARPWPLKVTS